MSEQPDGVWGLTDIIIRSQEVVSYYQVERRRLRKKLYICKSKAVTWREFHNAEHQSNKQKIEELRQQVETIKRRLGE